MIDRWQTIPALLFSGAACVLLLGAATGDGPGPASTDPKAAASSWRSPPGDPARGEKLGQVCLSCHRSDSPQIDPPAPHLFHQRESYIYRALREYRDGVRRSDVMGAFVEGQTDQDLRDLAAYLSGDMFGVPPKAHTEMPGYAVTSTECTWCHGETGIGEFEGMPVLTGQKQAYLEMALGEYRSGKRSDPTMREVAKGLDPAKDAAIAKYFASHQWLGDAE